MTRSDLRTIFRLYTPEVNSTDVLSDANLNTLLNLAAQTFVNLTDCLPTDNTFNAVTNQQDYNISSVLTDFGKIRKEGIWFYNKVSTKWKQLDSATIAYLNKTYPSWLNAAAGLPLRYYIEGDRIGLDPKPSSTYAGTNYVKVFYYKRSADMSADTHYPFSGSTTEYPHLADYEEVLFDWVKYRVKQIAGKNGDALEAKTIFYNKSLKIKQELLYRPDLIPNFRMKGTGNLTHFKEAFKH